MARPKPIIDQCPMVTVDEARWIPGFEQRYAARADGTILSYCLGQDGRPLRAKTNKRDKYLRVTLIDHAGVRHDYLLHRLILLSFAGPCPKGQEVRHLNGNPKDNRADNLCWSTHNENEQDKKAHGTRVYGELHGRHLLTEAQVRMIRFQLARGQTQISLAQTYGVSRRLIAKIKKRVVWAHI